MFVEAENGEEEDDDDGGGCGIILAVAWYTTAKLPCPITLEKTSGPIGVDNVDPMRDFGLKSMVDYNFLFECKVLCLVRFRGAVARVCVVRWFVVFNKRKNANAIVFF